MAQKPLHLVERAAARMLEEGSLDTTAAQLLAGDRQEGNPAIAVPPPGPVPIIGVASDRTQGTPPEMTTAGTAGRTTTTPLVIDLPTLQRAGMIDWSHVRSRVSEEFRLAQRQILRTAFSGPHAEPGHSNLLMVTSARPGEGKSFSSLNLGASIARQGDHNVLLIDVDSKDESVGRALGLSGVTGLLDLAADPSLEAGQLIVNTAIPHLSVLPLGTHLERSADLFAAKPMQRLIQSIARRFADRLVILDAAPCLSTSDPGALAPLVGQILFIVEAERTQREEVEAGLEHLQACPTITLLLNKVRLSTQHSFGAYASSYTS